MKLNFKHISLLLQMLVFILLIFTGLILMTISGEQAGTFYSIAKTTWINIHHLFSILAILLILFHVKERWQWLKYFVFQPQSKLKRKHILLKRNSLALFLIFVAMIGTGYTSWFMSDTCEICLGIHDKAGMILTVLFGFHLMRNKYFNRRFYKFRK